jgi:hypothetical protein
MKITDHGDLDPAVEKRLEIDDVILAERRADWLAWKTQLIHDALNEERAETARNVANYFCNDEQDRLVCLIAKAYWIGDWQLVIDELPYKAWQRRTCRQNSRRLANDLPHRHT